MILSGHGLFYINTKIRKFLTVLPVIFLMLLLLALGASLSQNSRKAVQRSDNHLPVESVEISREGQSYITRHDHNNTNHSSQELTKIRTGETRFCETTSENVPHRPSIYDQPRTNYSLIVTLPKKTKVTCC